MPTNAERAHNAPASLRLLRGAAARGAGAPVKRALANGATLAVLGLGTVGLALAAGPNARPAWALACLAAAGLIDGVDGVLARRAGGPTRLGAVLDVAADFVAFGLAPASLALARHGGSPLLWLALSVYLACSLARLVRACLGYAARSPAYFVGMPMPAAGFLMAGLALTLPAGWTATSALLVGALAISRRRHPTLPWMWANARQALAVWVVIWVTMMVVSYAVGLVGMMGGYAVFAWVKEVREA